MQSDAKRGHIHRSMFRQGHYLMILCDVYTANNLLPGIGIAFRTLMQW